VLRLFFLLLLLFRIIEISFLDMILVLFFFFILDNYLLLQPFCTKAQFLNGKAKQDMTEKLAGKIFLSKLYFLLPFCYCCFVLFFGVRVFLCSPGCLRTSSVDQDVLEFIEIHLPSGAGIKSRCHHCLV
jgi:hypothetical protein